MARDEEIRSIKEKLDYYTMGADDEQFDVEEVQKLLHRLDVLELVLMPWKWADKALKDFWKYLDGRQIIVEGKMQR